MTDVLSRDTFKAGLIAEGAVTVPTPSADTDAASKVYVDGKTLPVGGIPGQVLAKTGDTNYAAGWMSTADLAAGTAPTVVRTGSLDCTYGSGAGSWVSSGGLLQGQAGDLVIVCMFQWTGTTYTPTSSGLTFTSRLTQAQVSGASWLDRQFQMWSTTLPDATARELTMSRNAGGAGGVTVIHIRGTDGTYATDTGITAAANVVATTPKTITGYNGVSSRLIAFDLLLLDANSQADPVPATETTAGLWTSEISHTWDVNRNATWLGVNISTFSNAVPAATVALAVGATSVSYKFALAWNAPAASPPLDQSTADGLYVNVTGDTMTGPLYTEDTVVYGQLTVFEPSSFSSDLVVDGVLQVNTGIKLDSGYAAGHVLTSDASGNGTWQAPTGSGGGLDQTAADLRYEQLTRKDAASGYAGLDSGTKIVIGQIPTGVSGTTVALGNHLHTGVYDPAGTAIGAVSTHAATAGHELLSSTTPTALTPDIAGAIGSGTTVAKADHVHNVPAAAPTTNLTATTTNAEGSGTSFARNDHTHALDTAVPVALGVANDIGNSTSLARANHVHIYPTLGQLGAAATSHTHVIGDLPVAPSGTSNTTQVVRADDSRLSNARTPTTHTHVATTDLTATGTKDATTFLCGDNTWAVIPKITVATTAPSSPAINDIWVDSSP